MIRRFLIAAFVIAAAMFAPDAALAQSGCPYIQQGAVLTAAQWNACFQGKLDSSTIGVPGDIPIYNPSGTGFADSGIPMAPVGALPLYAAPAAAGSGSCLSAANACTLATACSFVRTIATFLGAAGPIQLADGSGGSYATATNGAVCNINGVNGGSSSQLTSINGNAITPTNVVIQVPVGADGFSIQDFGAVGINNLEITAVNGSGPGIDCRQLAICDYGGIVWGTWGNSGAHVAVTGGASANPDNETITGTPFVAHWSVSDGGHLNPGGTTQIPSAVNFSAAFLSAINGSIVDLSAWAAAGSGVAGSTGQRAGLSGFSYVATAGNASINSVVPGNSNSSIVASQTSGNDNMTSPMPVGGVSCPGGITAGTVTVVSGVVTHC